MSKKSDLTIKSAKKKILKNCNKPLKELVPDDTNFEEFNINKGKAGQLLELAIGKSLDNKPKDFKDGELKTYKAKEDKRAKETIAITQISSNNIDDILEEKPFKKSSLYDKIENTLFVPTLKEGNPEDWEFLDAIQVDLKKEKSLKKELKKDYKKICAKTKENIENGDSLHTVSGKFLQIRSKDTKPYHKVHSEKYNRDVSNKNYAFYFKKDFIDEIIKDS